MPTILVTGGAGYIGSHCCKELSKKGYTPVTIDNLVYGHKENVKWGDFIQGDIGDKALLTSCFERYQIDAVMHFAAYAYVGESVTEPMKYYENNLKNTLNLLNCMLAGGTRLFVFSSTCATYGNPEKIPIDEGHPQKPINPYGKTKLMIEEALKDYAHAYGLKFVSLRYFNAAGADPEGELGEDHSPETHLIPLVLDVAAGRSQSIKVFGSDYDTRDGTCIRDYIHITDLAHAHIQAIEKLLDGSPSDLYNLGTGHGYSVLEIIKKAEEITGKKIPYEKVARRPGDPPVLVASNQKALEQLGWQATHSSIDEIIQTAWNWHQKLP